jgi:hypothetical protein
MYRHAGELVDKILGGTKHDVGQSSRGRTSLEESPSLLQGLSIVLDGHGPLAGRLGSMRACVSRASALSGSRRSARLWWCVLPIGIPDHGGPVAGENR